MTDSHSFKYRKGKVKQMQRVKWMLFLIFLTVSLMAQENPLDSYIKQGLQSNLALQQQRYTLEQSMEALKEARGLFFPSLDLNARYSRAGGGRKIEIPIGDLVNPIYKTLNQLLIMEGLSPAFPENLPNQTVPFLREKEHDTYLRLVLPIIQPAIWSNYGLNTDLFDIEKVRTDIFKRSLVSEIKRGYYNYLKATKVVDLYEKIEDLQMENLRVSERLFEADKATKDIVYRARAEMSKTEQDKIQVENLQRQSKSYFNFILNRPLESEIILNDKDQVPFYLPPDLESEKERAFKNREEIKQIRSAISAAGHNESIARSRFYPGLSAALDHGFQGEKYRFTSDDDYWMASLVLQWNVFNGYQDEAKQQQAYLEKKKLITKEDEIKKQIELEVERILDNLNVAFKTIDVAKQQLESARESFKIIRKKFEEGIAAQIEYQDAQTTLTNAAINEVISTYDYFITYATYERIVASYQLTTKQD